MRQLKKLQVEDDASGRVLLMTEEAEDAWHLLNLVSVGDAITATTIRKVKLESGTAVASSKKQLRLTIQVKSVDFDNKTGHIRFGGVNVEENDFVKLGQHHTIEIDANEKEKLQLEKHAGGWDSFALDYLKTACAMEKTADLMVLLLDEACGIACLYAIGDVLIRDVFKINMTISRKHNDKQLRTFYENIFKDLFKSVDFNCVNCLVVAGPGFGKDNFHKFALTQSQTSSTQGLAAGDVTRTEFNRQYKTKTLIGNTSSAYKHSLHEILSDPKFQSKVLSTKTAKHTAALENFCQRLQADPDRVCYGFTEVVQSINEGAVEQLLVLDKLIRELPGDKRRHFVKLMEQVKNTGGTVLVFSEKHVSGELLKQMTGAAATLRWAVETQ